MEQIKVDLIPGRQNPVCHASQYDVGRVIRVQITDNAAAYTLDGTETITVEVSKPDGNFVTASCTATSGKTYVDVITTEQMTAVAGSSLCELKIEKGGDTLGTLNFIMEVERDPIDGASSSESVIENLQAMVNAAVAASPYPAEVEDMNLVSFANREKTKGTPGASNWNFINNANYLHVVIPVKSGDKVRIVASSAGTTYLAVVKSYSGTSTPPDYCSTSPYTGPITEIAGHTDTYTMPSDANYLIYVVKYNGTDVTPVSFTVNGYDFVKSAQENISGIETTIANLNGVKTWYVNSSTGSDDNDGSAAAKAFKTIQKAIDTVGPLKDATPNANADYCQAIITLAAGTYDPFVIDGKNIFFTSSGTVTIAASTGVGIMLKNGANAMFYHDTVIAQSGAFNSLSLRTNASARFLKTLTITNTSTAVSVLVQSNSMAFFNGVLSVTATSSTSECLYAQHASQIVIWANNSAIDCAGKALMSQSGSTISVPANPLTISANASRGLEANGGLILYRNITNGATIKEAIDYGGRIFTSSQTYVESKNIIDAGTDLNTITKPGIYRLNGAYTNVPDLTATYYGSSTTTAILFVLNANSSGASGNTVQILIYGAPMAVFHRLYTGASWYRWNSMGGNVFSYLKSSDLNDVKDQGLYIIDPTTYTYSNYPFDGDIKSIMYVMRGFADSQAVVQILYPMGHSIMPLFRSNVEASNTWVSFGKNDDATQFVNSYSHGNYSPIAHDPQTAVKLKVGTINIGHFNYGNSSNYGFRTAEYDKKLHNWRKYLCKQQFDFLNINEFVPYIDYLAAADWNTGTKRTSDYVLKPQFNYLDSSMNTDHKAAVIASKYAISNETEYSLTGTINNGYCRYYNVTIDANHVIGVYAVQLVFLANGEYDTQDAIDNRAEQLNSLASVIAGHNDNYVVVLGDFNTGTDDDLANVLTFCGTNNLVPANGGFLDWMRTHEGFAVPMSLDNILVSDNILINDFDVHYDWYESLSTDHFGISADITLT